MFKNALLLIIALTCFQSSYSIPFTNISHPEEIEEIELLECDENTVDFYLETETSADQISWKIMHNGLFVAEGGNYEDNTEYFEELCLEDGCYTLLLFGDSQGWNGAFFQISMGNNLLTWGTLPTDFGSFYQMDFNVNAPWCSMDGIPGCLDPEAENYNPQADVNDQSCLYGEECANAITATVNTESDNPYMSSSWTIQQGQEIIYSGGGYTDPLNYIENICLEDGCYTLHLDGLVSGTIALEMDGEVIVSGEFGDPWFEPIDFTVNYCAVPGCTDPEATNYDPEANEDDGSCIFGCYEVEVLYNNSEVPDDIFWSLESNGAVYSSDSETDSLCISAGCYSLNMEDNTEQGWNGLFEILVNGEVAYFIYLHPISDSNTTLVNVGSPGCGVPVLEGCTDPEANNYDEGAIENDGSCYYENGCDGNEVGISHDYEIGYSSDFISYQILDSEGDTIVIGNSNGTAGTNFVCLEDGCYTFILSEVPLFFQGGFSLYPTGDFSIDWDGAYPYYPNFSVNGSESSTYEVEFSINSSCGDEVEGCTDQEASNYDPNATVDDGSCIYDEAENDLCENATPLQEGIQPISNLNATSNENIWGECWASGNGEGEQTSIWYTFTTPADPAEITIEALPDGTNTLTDTQFGLFTECGGEMIECDGNSGEGLLSRLYFACGELEPNTEYLLIIDGYFGDSGTCLLEYSVDSDCDQNVEGCTDPAALNYDPLATINNGSCEYEDCNNIQFVHDYTVEEAIDSYNFPYEITNADGIVVANGTMHSWGGIDNSLCLPDGCYTITITEILQDWTGILSIALLDDYWQPSTYFEIIPDENDSFTGNFSVNDPSCLDEVIEGCTVYYASNYNPNANVYDGSCVYNENCNQNEPVIFVYSGSWTVSDDQGNIVDQGGTFQFSGLIEIICLPDGCYTIEFSSIGNSQADFELYLADELLASAENVNNESFTAQFEINSDCSSIEIEGCTDPEALNYDPEANFDDGSCEYTNCENYTHLIFGHAPNDTLHWQITNGGDSTLFEGISVGNAVQIPVCLPDGCYNMIITDLSESGWPTGDYFVSIYQPGGISLSVDFNNGDFVNFEFGINSDCDQIIEGCTDPEAVNYNPDATVDDGSCSYNSECSDNSLELIFDYQGDAQTNAIHWTIHSTSTDSILEEGTYSGAVGFFDLCLPDGCYNLSLTDLSNSNSQAVFSIFNDNSQLIFDEFSEPESGETVSYTFGVNTEGCEEEIEGCTDAEAVNYNSEATVDDGSCIYGADCSISFDLLADSSDLNTIFVIPSDSIGEAVGVLWDFGDGTTSTDFFPEHEYETEGPYILCLTVYFEVGEADTCDVTFCLEVSADMIPDLFPGAEGSGSSGFFINIIQDPEILKVDEMEEIFDFNVFPNPASDEISVSFNTSQATNSTLNIADMNGKIISYRKLNNEPGENNYKIDISNLSAGVYIITLNTDSGLARKRLVKD